MIDDPAGFVNVRAGKSADSAVIATVKTDEPFLFEWENDLDWYKVTLASGKSGWMPLSCLEGDGSKELYFWMSSEYPKDLAMNKNTRTRTLLVFTFAFGSLPAVSSAADLPECRPALLSRGSHSLANLINVESLVKRGQGSATVMFSCGVSSLGFAGGGVFYRGTPNSEMLGQEVVRRCDQAQFEPAIFRHNRVDVWLSGTVTLIIKDGKPHLRIYLNQEEDDLMKGHDFIAPQFIITAGFSKFRGFYWPPNASGHSGLAAATINVETTGQVKSSQIAYEFPAGMGFGAEVAGRVVDAMFIPAFRDGKQVSTRFTWPLMFNRFGPQMRTG